MGWAYLGGRGEAVGGVVSMTDDELWQAIESLARKQEPAIQQAVLSAFAALSQIVDTETLAAAVAMGPTAVLALFPDEAFVAAFQTMPKALHGAAVAAGTAEAKGLVARLTEALKTASTLSGGGAAGLPPTPVLTGLGGAPSWSPKVMQFQFDVLNPKVTEAVRQQAASLVVQVTQQVKDAIKEEVRLGMLRGENPRETARAIRQHIGLTAKQQQAVANFRQELMTFHERDKAGAWNLGGKISRAPGGAQTFAIGPDGKPLDQIQARRLRDFRYDPVLMNAMQTGTPLTWKQIDKMTEAYQRKYLRYRSETIATTEALRASNLGIHQAWRQAIDQKLINENWVRKRWGLALGSDRTCLICRPMPALNKGEDGLGIPLEDPFTLTGGGRIAMPPAHPRCRCNILVKLIG